MAIMTGGNFSTQHKELIYSIMFRKGVAPSYDNIYIGANITESGGLGVKPADDDDGGGFAATITEPADGAYARITTVIASDGTASWSVPAKEATPYGNDVVTKNVALLEFNTAGADWATPVHYLTFWTHASDQDVQYYLGCSQLESSKPIDSGDQLIIAINGTKWSWADPSNITLP